MLAAANEGESFASYLDYKLFSDDSDYACRRQAQRIQYYNVVMLILSFTGKRILVKIILKDGRSYAHPPFCTQEYTREFMMAFVIAHGRALGSVQAKSIRKFFHNRKWW